MMNPPASRGLVPVPVPVAATAAPAAAPARQPLSLCGDRDTGTTTTMTESTKQSEAVMSLAELRQRRLAAFVGRTSVAQQLQPIDNVQSHAKAKSNATAPAPAAVNRNLHSTMTAAPVITIDLCTSSSDDNEDEQDNDNDNDINNNNKTNKRHIDNCTTNDNEDISQSFLQENQLQTPPHWQSTSPSPPQHNRIHRKRAHRHCSNNSRSDSPQRSIHIPTDPAIVRTTTTMQSSNPSSSSTSSPASSQRKLPVAGIKAPPTTAKAATTTAQPVPPPASFQVASYNLWFGPAGDGAPHAAKRMQAIAQLLLDANTNDNNDNKPLLFIAFQEVIPALAQHLFPLLRQAGYTVLRQPYDPQYGCAFAVYTGNGSSTGVVTVIEKGWLPFTGSVMERGLLYVRAQLPSQQQQVLVTCTHLESFMNARSNGSQQGCQQAAEMASFCFEQWQRHKSHLIGTISMGDMNWDDASKSQSKEPPMLSIMMESIQNESNNSKRSRRSINSNNFLFCDAWLETIGAARPTASRRGGGAGVDDTTAGFTYDGKRNPMLSNQLRRRFDRCIVGVGTHGNGGGSDDSSTSAMLHPVACQLLGMETLPGLTWEKQNPWKNTITTALTAPSDHFGLLVHVQQ